MVRWALSLVLLLALMGHTAGFWRLPLIDALELHIYDLRLRALQKGVVDSRIVIVDIDEASLAHEGQWPWPRQRLAALVDTLFDHYKIRVLGLDMVFAEAQREPAREALSALAQGPLRDDAAFQRQWQRLRPTLDGDAQLARALSGRLIVGGFYFALGDPVARKGQLPKPALLVQDLGDAINPFVRASGYQANLAVLQNVIPAGGFINSPLIDADGLIRRLPLMVEIDGRLYPQLALAMAQTILEGAVIETVTARGYQSTQGRQARVEALRLGAFDIALDAQGAAWLPYNGPSGSFVYLPAHAVLQQRVAPEVLDGAVVLLGSTAAGLLDLRATPVGAVYPGVEIHATLLAGILDQRVPYRPPYSQGLTLSLLALLGLAGIGLGSLAPAGALLGTAALAGAVLGFNVYAWVVWNHIIDLAAPLLLLLLMVLLHSTTGYLVQSRQRRQLAQMFGQYVPPELVQELCRQPHRLALGGESREMTVLFSDIQDFTAISEQLKPQQLIQLMQFVLTPLTRAIHAQRGTVDKYIGDAIMAFWGAPLHDPDHARRAVYAALAMRDALAALAPELRARGWPELKLRIGVHTGIMNVGNMGSAFRMAYTVLGDAVNLASRLEGAAKNYGVSILISETTRNAVPEIACRQLDHLRVKGRQQPVTVYEPLMPVTDLTPVLQQALDDFAQAQQAYRQQDWPRALRLLESLQHAWPHDPVYPRLRARVEQLARHPPPADWDGVFTLEAK